MKIHLLPFLLIGILITACADNRVRKKPPVPSSPDELLTGCYYIVEDSTAVKRSLTSKDGNTETYYINPKAIVTVADFEEAKVNDEDPLYSLSVTLNERGKNAFAAASKSHKGKKLAFIISGELVMAPQIYDEIPGGSFEISGNFEKKELNDFLKAITYEMYEP